MPISREPYWTLAYVDEGTDLACWMLFFGQGLKGLPKEVTDQIAPEDTAGALEWAADEIEELGLTIGAWEPHEPEPGTQRTYWTSIPVHNH
ncbi:hypothetical protein [Streptomyces sp. NPDC059468]|uniref:hypothetical protein n=1 Tax=Streptomyces sp. NPDC059468 TaxID=3346845 RepID=UPI0036B94733